MRWTTRLRAAGSILAAAILFATFGTVSAADADVATWPAVPEEDCRENCASTLHASHDLTFVSRFAFPAGNALLTHEGKSELLQLLRELESYAIISHVHIIGHSDLDGPARYNQWLSKLRADRIAWHLRQLGVDPRKVTTEGRGSSEPLPGALDLAEHRRVEIRITVQPFR
jgi:OOP family OmpA-OmpF porin